MQSPGTSNALDGATVRGSVVQAGTVTGGVHLHHTAAAAPTPRELPASSAWWTNRIVDLAWCEGHLAAAPAGGPLVLVLAGPGGVGKSALATHWLERHAGDFPDGQLYADLTGQRDARAAGPIALRFLKALGVDPGPQIPDLDGLGALLRTATRARRLAVQLDGVYSAAQVRALLPIGPGCVAIITAHHRLEGLIAHGARTHTLGPLSPEAGRALLETALGAERVATQRGGAEAIARQCAGWPLALTVAAAHLATRPHQPLSALAAQLASPSERLDHLTLDGEHAVRYALDATYRDLPDDVARLYRLLGALPVALVDTESAAALLGEPEEQAQRLLETLAELHLLEPAAMGEYRIPELVHVHAQECLRRGDADDLQAAARRYGEFLLAGATAAEELLTPTHRLLTRTYIDAPYPVSFTGEAAALDWLTRYHGRLVAAVRRADQIGLRTLVWQLADAMWPLFLRVRAAEREEVQRLALDAARADGHDAAVGMMLTSLGGTLLSAGRPGESVGYFQQAWQLYQGRADLRGQGQASNGLAKAAFDQGEFIPARELFERALAEREAAGYLRGVALTRHGLGQVALALGEPTIAAEHLSAAYHSLLRLKDWYDAAWSAAHLASAYDRLGLHARATTLIEHADAAMDQARSPFGRGGVAELAATIAEARGEDLAACAQLERAIDFLAVSAPQRAERARARLRALQRGRTAPDG